MKRRSFLKKAPIAIVLSSATVAEDQDRSALYVGKPELAGWSRAYNEAGGYWDHWLTDQYGDCIDVKQTTDEAGLIPCDVHRYAVVEFTVHKSRRAE